MAVLPYFGSSTWDCQASTLDWATQGLLSERRKDSQVGPPDSLL